MAKQAITLKIAGKSYGFTIESSKEEIYRLAEREVNNYITATKQHNVKGWTERDYLAIAALKFAIANVDLHRERSLTDDDLQRLADLDTEIDEYLNKL